MRLGFALRRLSLTGPGVPPAEIVFTRGLNVIAGPSDSGKSFILQCINYALGGGAKPKEIPEADRYTTVLLEIQANKDDRIFTLERGLRGGHIRLATDGEAPRVLAAKHKSGNDGTVSRFLLGLCGLDGKLVRTNAQGTTRPLGFRDIARLVLINETTVIDETSPILSGQYTKRTVESGVFRLLLTGTDDSSVIAKEDPKVAKGQQEGKVEVLKLMVQKAGEGLAYLGSVGSLTDERERLGRLEMNLQEATADRDAEQKNAAPLETKRRTAWKKVRGVDSELNVFEELQRRFDLLQDQYESDLRRLEATSETGQRLGQLKEERCPMCGALPEHQDNAHRVEPLSFAYVPQACRAEAAETARLLGDLQLTRSSTATKVEELSRHRTSLQAEFDVADTELNAVLEQRVNVATQKVDEIRARRDACKKAIEHLERLADLEGRLAEATAPRKRERAEGPPAAISTGQAEPFSREVESLLREWHYPPKLERVVFSEEDQDIVISGRGRSTHGKGVRAIYRAAFNLALLRHVVREERPFPGFVLIDSPLIVYEKPDPGETEFPQDVKRHFWDSVKSAFADAQVIIIENHKQLPSDGIDGVNLVVFTGNDQGRRGFIPQTGDAS